MDTPTLEKMFEWLRMAQEVAEYATGSQRETGAGIFQSNYERQRFAPTTTRTAKGCDDMRAEAISSILRKSKLAKNSSMQSVSENSRDPQSARSVEDQE